MTQEAEVLPLSALQHFLFCPRQCALIHIESVWTENRFTAEGRILHQRVDSGGKNNRGEIAADRSVPLRSEILGLYGVADVVEMRPGPDGNSIPYPVEYKRGSPKIEDWDRIQLCAQAMCLEEMLNVEISDGAIFYGQPRRREKVVFDFKLRKLVETECARMHSMIKSAQTPAVEQGKKCRNCSLADACMPWTVKRSKVESYIIKGLGD